VNARIGPVGAVSATLARAAAAGLCWATVQMLSEEALEERLYGAKAVAARLQPERSPARADSPSASNNSVRIRRQRRAVISTPPIIAFSRRRSLSANLRAIGRISCCRSKTDLERKAPRDHLTLVAALEEAAPPHPARRRPVVDIVAILVHAEPCLEVQLIELSPWQHSGRWCAADAIFLSVAVIAIGVGPLHLVDLLLRHQFQRIVADVEPRREVG
jgi:hypothetical protein